MSMTQPTQAPIKAKLLSTLVQERMLADIITGRYKPGARLNLDAIAEECGVSRMPIREALQALGAVGFVSVARNARTVVADWSAEDMRERVVVIGRLVANLAADLRDFISVECLVVRIGTDSDFTIYLDLVTEIVALSLPRLADYLQRSFITPLRLFVQAEVLLSHGLRPDERSSTRADRLTQACAAFADGDRTGVAHALTRYADEFALALTRPEGECEAAPRTVPAADAVHVLKMSPDAMSQTRHPHASSSSLPEKVGHRVVEETGSDEK